MESDLQTYGERARAETASAIEQLTAELRHRIGPKRYNAWFKHTVDLQLEEDMLRISVPNPFVANWIEGHYLKEIHGALETVFPEPVPCVHVMLDPSLNNKLRKRQLDDQADIVRRTAAGRTRKKASTVTPIRHSLGDFVVGQSNKLAYSAAEAVAAGNGVMFNPLFVHGPCGVGKTHLLHGVCDAMNRAGREGKMLRWRYVTAEGFTNEFIGALRQKKLEEFRARYRQLDVLAIDDVHFLAAKRATQDEFLHTFNAIANQGNQVLLASDTHPRLVADLNEQLVSRFLAGMVVKIDTPDPALRLKILERLADRLRMNICPEVLEYIASHVHGSVRELEGTLVKLGALAALESGLVTLDLARETLADHLARTESAISLGEIEAVVSSFFGVTPADIHSSRRTRTVSAARAVTMLLARRHTQMSFPEIGRAIGKNHSSVVLGVQRMEKLLEGDGQIEWQTPEGKRRMQIRQVLELVGKQIF
jgi:chromosomal replication initiator protein